VCWRFDTQYDDVEVVGTLKWWGHKVDALGMEYASSPGTPELFQVTL
jgi:hypothetical protein